MNLDTIAIAPHAEGFIKIACETDPLFADRPRTSNEFLITARHHARPPQEGSLPTLAPHPLHERLAEPDDAKGRPTVKEIPIRLFFNKPEKALRISYQAFSNDTMHVPVCSGNGKDATRLITAADNTASTSTVACAGPERCPYVLEGRAVCRRQVRMAVQIKDQPNPLTVFEVRTSSINSYRALRAQLQVIDKMFGGLRHVPLKLTLWQSSNEASGYEAFDLIQLTLDATDVASAMDLTKKAREAAASAGLADDFDTLAADGEVELGAPTLDYQAMSELYEPARRRGASTGASAVSSHGGYVGSASALVSAALQGYTACNASQAPGDGATAGDSKPVLEDIAH